MTLDVHRSLPSNVTLVLLMATNEASGDLGASRPEREADISQYESENVDGPASREADVDDADLETMKQRVAEMEAEAAKLREMNEAAERDMGMTSASIHPTEEEKMEVDARSIYVGNVSESMTNNFRWTTVPHRKRSSSTFKAVAQLTV